MLRVVLVLARSVAPVFARQAQAALVMNTTDMTAPRSAIGDRFAAVPTTTLDDLLRPRPRLGQVGG